MIFFLIGWVSASVVFSEIHYFTNKSVPAEFVELANIGATPVVIPAKSVISGGISYVFAESVTLAADMRVIIAQNVTFFARVYGFTPLGPFTRRLSNHHDALSLSSTAGTLATVVYKFGFPWPAPLQDVHSIQLSNAAVPGNAHMGALWQRGEPTPGTAAGQLILPMPPVDHVFHVTQREKRQATVYVRLHEDVATAGTPAVKEMLVLFQNVPAGAYLRRNDDMFTNTTSWVTVRAFDDGRGSDLAANDHTFAARVPAEMLKDQTLVRYRLAVRWNGGSRLLPGPGDVPNFALFWLDEPVPPPYTGAIDPSAPASSPQAQNLTVHFDKAEPIPVIHVLAVESDVYDALFMWKSKLQRGYYDNTYRWICTLVIDGVVYDHVRFRSRGQFGRYAYGKNPWKFRFNRGWFASLRHDGAGRKAVPGQKLRFLNLHSLFLNLMSGWRRQYEPVGTHGLPQLLSKRYFELMNVPEYWMSFVHLRVVVKERHAAVDQYDSDFWGLYLALEEVGDSYLDRHNLPDGNLLKANKNATVSALKHQGFLEPDDRGPLSKLREELDEEQTEEWARTNIDLELYYRYRVVAVAIGHLDIGTLKNWLYYRSSALSGGDRRWKVLPWDLDRTFVPSLAKEDVFQQVLRFESTKRGYAANMQSFSELFCNNGDEPRRVMLEEARRTWDPAHSHHVAEADRRRWDFSTDLERMPNQQHPFNSNPSAPFQRMPAPKGMFYVRSNDITVPSLADTIARNISKVFLVTLDDTALFSGSFERMRDNYLSRVQMHHCEQVGLTTPSDFDRPPALDEPLPVGSMSVDDLAFSVAFPPLPVTTGWSIEWRLGERYGPVVTPNTYDPVRRNRYELQARETATHSIAGKTSDDWKLPLDMSLVGALLRVRARLIGTQGEAGPWSPPFEFVGAPPKRATPPVVVSEVMYHAPGGSQHDYIELTNLGDLAVRLTGVRLDGGIRFAFDDDVFVVAGGSIVVADDVSAFKLQYPGVAVLETPYRGALSNGGETVEVKDAGGNVLDRVQWTTNLPFDSPLADGGGLSLERVNGDNLARPALLQAAMPTPGQHSMDKKTPCPLVVNEVMASPMSGRAGDDWLELLNRGDTALVLDGQWFLTNDVRSNPKFVSLAGTLAAGAFLVLSRKEMGFALASRGDEGVFVVEVDAASGAYTGRSHGFRFGGTPKPGQSLGRFVTRDGREHLGVPFSVATPGNANAYPATPPLTIRSIGVDLPGHRLNARLRHANDIEAAQPSTQGYVELESTRGAVRLSTTLFEGHPRWCLRGCRHRFCFSGDHDARRVLVADGKAELLRIDAPEHLFEGAGVTLAGPSVLNGVPSDSNQNVYSKLASDACTQGGPDQRLRLERHWDAGEDRRVEEEHEAVDMQLLAWHVFDTVLVEAQTNVSMEDRGAVRFVRVSPAVFAGDLAAWRAHPLADRLADTCSGDGSMCVSPSPCVEATGCEAGRCVYRVKVCPAASGCMTSYCDEAAGGCVERPITTAIASRARPLDGGVSALCAVDATTTEPVCGNGLIEDGEVCDGELCCAIDCSAVLSSGVPCRAREPTYGCDAGGLCDGLSATCDTQEVFVAGTVCRSASLVRSCDVAEECDGRSGFCPVDGRAPFLSDCDLSDANNKPGLANLMCLRDTKCSNTGLCHGLYGCDCSKDATLCDTGDPCWIGTCVGSTCERTLAPQGTTCDDRNPCTLLDVCGVDGVCAGDAGPCGSCVNGRCCGGECECEPGWRGLTCEDVFDPPSQVFIPDEGKGLFDDLDSILLYGGIGVGACCLCISLSFGLFFGIKRFKRPTSTPQNDVSMYSMPDPTY